MRSALCVSLWSPPVFGSVSIYIGLQAYLCRPLLATVQTSRKPNYPEITHTCCDTSICEITIDCYVSMCQAKNSVFNKRGSTFRIHHEMHSLLPATSPTADGDENACKSSLSQPHEYGTLFKRSHTHGTEWHRGLPLKTIHSNGPLPLSRICRLMTLHREDLIIFWDYETTGATSAASSTSTYEIVKNIRAAVASYGPIKAFKSYADFTRPEGASKARIALSSSGVTLVDCPSEGSQDAHSKIMITDMLIHAWDHSPPTTFVVITADRDLAYPIALLRTRDYRVLLICPSTIHPSLPAQASTELDWTRIVLGIQGDVVDEDAFLDQAPGSGRSFPTTEQPRVPPSDAEQKTHTASEFKLGKARFDTPSHSTQDSNLSRENPLEGRPSRPLPIPRARRNSTFPGQFEADRFNVFNDSGHGFAHGRLARGPLDSVPQETLFSRPLSRAAEPARADSAPPNVRRSSAPAPSIPAFVPPQIQGFSAIGSWGSSLKGKEKDSQASEPLSKETVPAEQSSGVPLANPPIVLTNKDDSKKRRASTTLSPPPGLRSLTPTPPLRPRSLSPESIHSMSLSPTSSLHTDFSFVPPIELSTVPTSAQTVDTAKSDATFKPPAELGGGNDKIQATVEELVEQDDLEAFFRDTVSQSQLPEPVVEPVDQTVEEKLRVPSPAASLRSGATYSVSTPSVKSVARVPLQPPTSVSPPNGSTAANSQSPVPPPAPAPPAEPSKSSAKSQVKPSVASGSRTAAAAAPTPALPASQTRVPPSSVPPRFQPLVQVLRQEQRGDRADGVDKSHLGSVLPKKFPQVYNLAKCSKFKTYIALAVEARIVKEVVNQYGEQCVSLRPQYRA
ncbi:hypothetical protein CVT26_010656 [Gymnopilus dilepis]|uniref:NYN domain-containing protein n=1 Tax=Gymnopilus dilepis TaxID=231916 RepID=A0A409VIF5_9AGAR|nr:hypothetical protein CVT26_010656 [Gymnopilus dilepis]